MIGGFLGAGKTTAVAAVARHLTSLGQRVGLITNDQGRALVDTRMLRSRGYATEEITGGCFCCRFHSLVDAANKLMAAARPDAFVAEPVGSCTDLMATVTYPLRRLYGDRFSVAPLSVLVDPTRAQQIFGLRLGRTFSSKVQYIWRKQLEEADILVISKVDLLAPDDLEELQRRFSREFPGRQILAISARTGAGMDRWFDLLRNGRPALQETMPIDYDIYADGEALLGWLNATLHIAASAPLDSTALLQELSGEMARQLADAEIAHLKMTLSPDDSLAGEVAALSIVRSGVVPELALTLDEPITKAELMINCRAETDPENLRAALESGLALLRRKFPQGTFRVDHAEQFRPGRPQPTHRMTVPDGAVAFS